MHAASCGKWPFRHLRQFGRDTSGTISIFTMTLMVLMIGIGGLALDTMRLEQQRVSVQNALDRCTLMAASLKQTLDPKTVVYDCMDKEGLKSRMVNVLNTTLTNRRIITSTATTALDSLFPNAAGIAVMNFNTTSKAEHRIGKIEISLALDVSGSMAGTRLTDLKTAAKNFVTTVLKDDTEKRVSISIVPYNGQVNLGATLRAFYTPTYTPGRANMNCLDLPDSVYSSLSLPITPYPMTGYADTYFPYPSSPAGTAPTVNLWCPESTSNTVTLASQSESGLHNSIDGLTAVGATSINLGMRWALALMDPGTKPIYDAMFPSTTSGGVTTASPLAGRPFSYTEPETMKIIVLMTDGENWPMEKLNDGYQSGPSPIYKGGNGTYAIFHPEKSGTSQYYSVNNNAWYSTAKLATGNTTFVQQTWQQVWEVYRTSYVAQAFYANAFPSNAAFSYNTVWAKIRGKTDTATGNTPIMDAQLQSVCSLAKGQSVIVYGIAFQATTVGQTNVRNCASSAAHYFTASGSTTTAGAQLSQAFSMIATNITQLKLTL